MGDIEDELTFRDYFIVFRRHWRWVAGTFVLGLALVTIFTLSRDEVYRSRAEVLFLTDTSRSLFPFSDEVAEGLLRTALGEIQFTSNQQYLRAADEAAGFEGNVEVEVVVPEGAEEVVDSSVLRFSAVDADADRAQTAAQAHAETYISLRQQQDIAAVTDEQAAITATLADLQSERSELQADLLDLRAERAAATDPARIAELDRQIVLVQTESGPAVNLLTNSIADARADLLLIDRTLDALEQGQSAAALQKDAFLPQEPISPDVPRNLIIGAIAALVLGLVLAIARHFLDSRARDRKALTRLVQAPVLTSIPHVSARRAGTTQIPPFVELPPAAAASYRALLTSLWLKARRTGPLGARGLRTIAFTSTRARVGKTEVVVQLAQAATMRLMRVLVIDADFTNPSVASRLGVTDARPTLDDVLLGDAAIDAAIKSTPTPNLEVIVGGAATTPDFVRPGAMGELLSDRRMDAYDLVLIDSPPTLGFADSRLVAALCDAVVVVYDPDGPRDDVLETLEALRSAKANLVGLVECNAKASPSSARD